MSDLVGRRVSSIDDIILPGDYFGPIKGYTGDKPAVFYLLPNANDEDVKNGYISHICSPPHTFRECPDGSLEIRASILHKADRQWHGYLNEGHVWVTT